MAAKDEGDIGYMLGKIDGRLDSIDEHIRKQGTQLEKHDAQFTKINLAAAKFGGIVIAATAILGLIWTFVFEYLKVLFKTKTGI